MTDDYRAQFRDAPSRISPVHGKPRQRRKGTAFSPRRARRGLFDSLLCVPLQWDYARALCERGEHIRPLLHHLPAFR